MRIDSNALGRALGDNLFVDRRIGVIYLGEESVEQKMPRFLAAGILLAEMAPHAADTAHFAHFRAAHGIIAKHMDRGGSRNEFDEIARANAHTLAATYAKTFFDLGKPVCY